MNRTRLEAFSDGVFAIIITIMVLELKVPEGTSLAVIKPLMPVFLCYLLSFVFIAIYWGNHHHLMHTAKKVNAGVIWANMNLLFWLSLVPFATGWMGINNFEKVTVAAYGALLFCCGISFTLLSIVIKKSYVNETELAKAIANGNIKSYVSLVLYGCSVPVALFIHPIVSAILFVAVSIMWIIPSKEIERALDDEHL